MRTPKWTAIQDQANSIISTWWSRRSWEPKAEESAAPALAYTLSQRKSKSSRAKEVTHASNRPTIDQQTIMIDLIRWLSIQVSTIILRKDFKRSTTTKMRQRWPWTASPSRNWAMREWATPLGSMHKGLSILQASPVAKVERSSYVRAWINRNMINKAMAIQWEYRNTKMNPIRMNWMNVIPRLPLWNLESQIPFCQRSFQPRQRSLMLVKSNRSIEVLGAWTTWIPLLPTRGAPMLGLNKKWPMNDTRNIDLAIQ